MGYLFDKYEGFKDTALYNKVGDLIEGFRKSKYLNRDTYTLEEIERDIRTNSLIKYIRRKVEEGNDYLNNNENLSPEVAEALDKEHVTENKVVEDLIYGPAVDL